MSDDTRRPGAAMMRQEALIAELTERVRQLERERDAMRADAERYRWLRDVCPNATHLVRMMPGEMDQAVDAARGMK